MKKILMLSAALTMTIASTAQMKYDIKATQELAGERNVFKAPPSLQSDSGLLQGHELYRTAPFSRTSMAVKFSNKLGQKGDYRLKGDVESQNYFGLENANQGKILGEARYRYNFNKKFRLGLTGGLGRINRLGINVLADEEVLRFSYITAYLKPELSYKINKQNRITGHILVGLRNYDALPSGTDLTFRNREIGVSHLFNLTEQDAFTFSLISARRNYINRLETAPVDLEEAELEELNGNYFMSYHTAKVAYKHKLDKFNYYKGYVRFQHRKDIATAEWTYTELRTGITIAKRYDKLGIVGTGYFAMREFPNRKPHLTTNNDAAVLDETLRYKYLNVGITGNYYITKKLTMFGTVEVVNRFSNSTSVTRAARRNYHQQRVIAGITWNISGKSN